MKDYDLISYLAQAYQHEQLLWDLLTKMPVSTTLRPAQMLFKGSARVDAYFVHRGIVKGFYYDEAGREQITRFWHEHQIILLADTADPQAATADHIQAIESCSLSAITYASAASLNFSAGQTARFAAKILLADRNMAEVRAYLCAMTSTQAYREFAKLFPAYRIPLRDVAAYLGITPQTISEIRKNIRQP